MTEDEATRLIQIHERARQGRLRAQFMREIRHMKDKAKPDPLADDKTGAGSRAAALRIQKIWRGFITRRKIRRRVVEEMLLIGTSRYYQVVFRLSLSESIVSLL